MGLLVSELQAVVLAPVVLALTFSVGGIYLPGPQIVGALVSVAFHDHSCLPVFAS